MHIPTILLQTTPQTTTGLDSKKACSLAGVTMTYLRPYVTGSNGIILNEVGRTTAVSLVGVHQGPGVALGHSFGTPPHGSAGQCQSRDLDWYD
jgi:hypothetical protein